MNHAPDTLPRPYRWRDEALCRTSGADPELWFPNGTTGPAVAQERDAKAICDRCPVLAACRQWALDTHQQYGVWGGMTEKDRDRWRRRRNRKAARARTPIVTYGSHQHAYDTCTRVDSDHLVWTGGNEIKVGTTRYSPNQTAWWVTRGTAPVGRVFTDCNRSNCVQHLTDQTTRNARKAVAA